MRVKIMTPLKDSIRVEGNRMSIDLSGPVAYVPPQVSWEDKNPEIYKLMCIVGCSQYELAFMCGMYPGTLSKKLCKGLSSEETKQIIDAVCMYALGHLRTPAKIFYTVMLLDEDGQMEKGSSIWMITEKRI